ncbi:hypothetical protein ACQPX6_25175 [Actinomycetospora sp. CA-101289]|uniref:hypothetical protein n=1 Tax=Actinomycetospora sp. CA-101289 TaxID=3239893 RepID=UPI003D993086
MPRAGFAGAPPRGPGWPVLAPPRPALPPAPPRRRRPWLVVGIVGSALLVLVVAASLLVRPGVLLPVAAPCEAAPGSTLAGFPGDMVGPTDITAALAVSASSAPVGVRACIYGTPGIAWGGDIPPGGRGIRVITWPRAAAEGDPAFLASLGSSDSSRTPPGARQVVLPGTGVTGYVRSSSAEDLTRTDVRCRTDTAYFDLAAAVSGTATDDVDSLDALTTVLGCEPI